jgi:transposase
MTIDDVSKRTGLSWHAVKELDKKYLKSHFGKPLLKNLEYLAIDEIAYKKGHKYLTVIYDLIEGRAVHVYEGRGAGGLKVFLRRIKASGAKIKAVATDMWEPFWGTVQEELPKALIVFDLFHIVKHYSKCMDDLRIALYRDEHDLNKRSIIKGVRWLLLKNDENLSDVARLKGSKSERERLKDALAINAPLAAAYYLKDELKMIWNSTSVENVEADLEVWLKKAESLGLQPLNKFCRMLRTHRTGIYNWQKAPISTGPLEGFNNKIKVMKRMAYGYRDMEYFKLKIMALHRTRYALLR